MPEKISLKSAFSLPPEKAVEYFESKGYKITFDWRDMQREAHTKAFTVAGVTKADVLEDLRDALLESEKQGLSYGQFKSLIIPTLQKKGWYGKREVSRPDGSVKEVDLSLPHRLRTIFSTNMRTSMMAGRYRQMKDAASRRPYWRYVAVMDGRTREAHRLLNGKIFRHDDPFWDSHFPPNGWGCRCRVVSISKEEFREKNYRLSNGETLKKAVPVAPEWAYNPGKRDWKPGTGRYSHEIKMKLEKELESIGKNNRNDTASNPILEKREAPDIARLSEEFSRDEIYSAFQYKSSACYEINRRTRNGLPLTPEQKHIADTLESLLAKLPIYKGIVTRSLFFYSRKAQEDFIQGIYKDREHIDFKQLLSSTCGKTYNTDGQVELIIISKTGSDFRKFNSEEQEILFKAGTAFKLLKSRAVGDKHYIVLEELEP